MDVPAGLPSDLLLRRPDLRQAEERLKAANARIGVARAAYFPSITLTGFYGGESQQLSDLFTGPARTWSLAAGLLQPVYGAGQIAAGVDLADARTREAALAYQQAIANAFREARNAIVAQGTTREVLRAQRERERVLVARPGARARAPRRRRGEPLRTARDGAPAPARRASRRSTPSASGATPWWISTSPWAAEAGP